MITSNDEDRKNAVPRSKGLLARAVSFNETNAIEEQDGVFSINKNLLVENVEMDPFFKDLVDTVLRQK